jgi:hypothetical protein
MRGGLIVDPVLYSPVCTFPPEYCEFGSSFTRCKEWLKEEHPELFEKYYSEGVFTFSLIIVFPKLSIPTSIPSDNIGRFFVSRCVASKTGYHKS